MIVGLKSYFALTSRERNGLFAIVLLCCCVIFGDVLFRRYYRSPTIDLSALEDSVNAFYASSYNCDNVSFSDETIAHQSVVTSHRKVVATSLKSPVAKPRPLLHIEINSASKEELVKIRGIGDFYAEQIIQLRERYGGFKDLEPLGELYGMDRERLALWERELYIDSTKCYAKVMINTADSAQWCAIPCIKSYDAGRIVGYRERLGGFYSAEQLKDLSSISEKKYQEIMLRAQFDEVVLRSLDVNNARFREVLRHPYIGGYENTKAIFRYLEVCPIENWEEFCKIPNLNIENLEGLKYYLSFEPLH